MGLANTSEMFDIAVILINYNSSVHTINCVNSILEKTSENVNYQLIITDNCSEVADYEKLVQYCDGLNSGKIQLHRSIINTGFGGGNMFGVQFAKAKYLTFLNNDTIFINDVLGILKSNLDSNPEIGIAGGQSFYENGDFMISLDHFASPGREIFGRSMLEKINPIKYPKRKTRYTDPVKVNFVPGSLMFVRAAHFNAVGGFDTNIFLYYEETDLCLRLANAGKHAYLIPAAQFVHLHGASTERSLAIKKELKISVLYVIRKHYGFWGHKAVLYFLIIKYFFSSIVKPKNRSLFALLVSGAPLSKSLKTKQQITPEA